MVQQGEDRWVNVAVLVMSVPWWACQWHTWERAPSPAQWLAGAGGRKVLDVESRAGSNMWRCGGKGQ